MYHPKAVAYQWRSQGTCLLWQLLGVSLAPPTLSLNLCSDFLPGFVQPCPRSNWLYLSTNKATHIYRRIYQTLDWESIKFLLYTIKSQLFIISIGHFKMPFNTYFFKFTLSFLFCILYKDQLFVPMCYLKCFDNLIST